MAADEVVSVSPGVFLTALPSLFVHVQHISLYLSWGGAAAEKRHAHTCEPLKEAEGSTNHIEVSKTRERTRSGSKAGY